MMKRIALSLSLLLVASIAVAQGPPNFGILMTPNSPPGGGGGGGAPTGPAGGNLAGTYPNPTLQVIGSATGPLGSATVAPVVTIDNKGRVTALTSATIAPPFSAVTGQATLAQLPTLATNTILGNATAGSAVPTALAVGTCSTASSALRWTTNTGFGCNTAIDAVTLGGATFAAPGAIGGGTPAAGSFTTLAGSSLALGGATIGSHGLAVTGTVLFNSALTYGGVTLSNAVTGTGNMVLASSPSLTTPALGVATATSLAIGGATIGSNALAVTGTAAISSTITSGVAGSSLGSLQLSGNTSGTVTVRPAAAAGTWTLTLPTNDGDSGQFLQTNGSGVSSWASASAAPAGADTQVQYNDGGAFGGNAQFTFNETSGAVTVNSTGAAANTTILTVQNSNLSGTPGFEYRTSNGVSAFVIKQGNSGGGLVFQDFNTEQLFALGSSIIQARWGILGTGFAGTLGDLIPGTDNQNSIGDATHRVKNIYTSGFVTWGGLVRVATQFDKTSSTALGNITGLSVDVAAGRTYTFRAVLYTTSNIAGGVQAAIGGTATATAIIYQGRTLSSTTLGANDRATSLGTAVGAVTAVTAAFIEIDGTITVNAAGTLTVQFAQNASNAAASSVLVGSSFTVHDAP